MHEFNLQVLRLDNNILGLAINQKLDNKLIAVTPYYFYPINEAWKQMQRELELKSWVSEKEKIRLLNSAVEILSNWQQSSNYKKNL